MQVLSHPNTQIKKQKNLTNTHNHQTTKHTLQTKKTNTQKINKKRASDKAPRGARNHIKCYVLRQNNTDQAS
jgi:hypothetical protein